MNEADLITYWIESSDRDFVAMQHLFKKKDYTWSLFIGHLVIEKLLKAYIFGSYANGKFNDNSDFDLAIVLNNLSNSFTMQIQLMKFLTRAYEFSD